MLMRKSTCLVSAKWRKPRSTERCKSSSRSSLTSTTTVPDSIFDRSRISLMSIRRSLPEAWMVLANSPCLGARLPSGFLQSWSDRISMLLSEQAGLLLQRFVGLLQLLLATLQFLGERLRLFEQILGTGVGRDGVDDDADGFGQLIEDRLMRRAEAFNRRKLEHAARLTFKHHRQHQHVHGGVFAEARGDAQRCRGDVGQ